MITCIKLKNWLLLKIIKKIKTKFKQNQDQIKKMWAQSDLSVKKKMNKLWNRFKRIQKWWNIPGLTSSYKASLSQKLWLLVTFHQGLVLQFKDLIPLSILWLLWVLFVLIVFFQINIQQIHLKLVFNKFNTQVQIWLFVTHGKL